MTETQFPRLETSYGGGGHFLKDDVAPIIGVVVVCLIAVIVFANLIAFVKKDKP